eukprot:scaffold909_cov121-Isochrysis_galbana.AAC.16
MSWYAAVDDCSRMAISFALVGVPLLPPEVPAAAAAARRSALVLRRCSCTSTYAVPAAASAATPTAICAASRMATIGG